MDKSILFYVAAGALLMMPFTAAAESTERTTLTGDWGGLRTNLAESGISFDIDMLNSYQGVLHGGTNQHWQYGGSMDYLLKFDFQKMGLWEGAFLDVLVEHQFGDFVNAGDGTILATGRG